MYITQIMHIVCIFVGASIGQFLLRSFTIISLVWVQWIYRDKACNTHKNDVMIKIKYITENRGWGMKLDLKLVKDGNNICK